MTSPPMQLQGLGGQWCNGQWEREVAREECGLTFDHILSKSQGELRMEGRIAHSHWDDERHP